MTTAKVVSFVLLIGLVGARPALTDSGKDREAVLKPLREKAEGIIRMNCYGGRDAVYPKKEEYLLMVVKVAKSGKPVRVVVKSNIAWGVEECYREEVSQLEFPRLSTDTTVEYQLNIPANSEPNMFPLKPSTEM